MKIRQGFVSNSSTCSFMIYGVFNPEIDIHRLFQGTEGAWAKWYAQRQAKAPTYNPDTTFEDWCDNLLDDVGFEDTLWYLAKLTGEESNLVGYQTDWGLYIGRDPKHMTDDETTAEFKANTKEAIAKIVVGDFKCEWQQEEYPC